MKKNTLSDQAYDLIKKKLIDCEKGSFLSARESARDFGMSYTPMREAFQRLEREGFLKLIPNVGFFVVSIEVTDVITIFQVRECMEPFVIEKVMNILTDKDIQMLEENNRKQRSYIMSGDIWKYVNADEAFHMKLFETYGNPYLLKTYKNVREQYHICSNKIASTFSLEASNEHQEFIEALKVRDKDLAVEACKKHIEKAKQRIIDGFIRVADY
ncbi:MAG: GntR family transcriptional regulator [Clostridia bacterium]